MGNATQLKGSWPMDKVLAVLGNATARAILRGKPCPISELVLARLTTK